MDCISKRRTYLREVKPHLICPLCQGYLIDATTIVECLHSFCRSCILKHLRTKAQCPQCNQLVNTAKPNIKADKTLQDIVYKLVPGLYHKEMKKRREFYSKHPDAADAATPEQRGEDVSGRLIFAPEDAISLSLEYLPVTADPLAYMSGVTDAESESIKSDNSNNSTTKSDDSANGLANNRRYLQCPALVTIAHLKKFLALKYSVDVTRFNIDICHRRASLPDHWTLMDVAYIFAWKRNAPIRFFYRINQETLEAPSNDRPSTPGLGASQPLTPSNEPITTPLPIKNEQNKNELKTDKSLEAIKKSTDLETTKPIPKLNPLMEFSNDKNTITPTKRSSSNSPLKECNTKSSPPDLIRADDALKQVKSPIKIMKNSDGRYQVLRTSPSNGISGHKSPKNNNSSEPKNSKNSNSCDYQKSPKSVSEQRSPSKLSPPPATAEFSVVSIGDGANNNGGVKITLKQCTPGSNTKKPKVISNLLLRSPSEENKSEKLKRKASVDSCEVPLKQIKKPDNEKKSFLHSFRLAAKNGEGKKIDDKNIEVNKPRDNNNKEPSVEEQVRNIIRNSEANRNLKHALDDSPSKKRQSEIKLTSTNIAERLGNPKVILDHDPSITSTNDKSHEPIDVYAFPSDPPTSIMQGAVKRKCPPALPIYEARKKQPLPLHGKRSGVNTTKGNPMTVNFKKPISNDKSMVQDKSGVRDKSILSEKQSPNMSPRPLQNLPISMSNSHNVEATITPVSSSPHTSTVSSTSPIMSSSIKRQNNDSRNLLDGCGLNIPASLSITLTAAKSQNHEIADGSPPTTIQNPSISLNDKSVDPLVLKALKSGQIRMTPTNNKEPKKTKNNKKDSNQSSMQPPKNAYDMNNYKVQSIKIPSPSAKSKRKSPTNWVRRNNPLPIVPKPPKEETQLYSRGHVVTLNSGQRFYRAPPGSLTPAVHRLGDIPTPTRTPVYAPFFSPTSSPSSSPRPMPNLPNLYPSLQTLYPINQNATFETFNIPNTQIRLVSANDSPTQPNKSHIAAQCAPIKPSRTSGSFAIPVAKTSNGLTIRSVNTKSGPNKQSTANKTNDTVSNAVKSETATSTQVKVEEVSKKEKDVESEESKEATPTKSETDQSDKCPTSSTGERGNGQSGSDSPRVSSTASPSPPPTENSVSERSSNNERSNETSNEGTVAIKSPVSPDSSSVVTEDNAKSTITVKVEEAANKDSENKDNANDAKVVEEIKKEENSDLHQRFRDAFPPHKRKELDSDDSKAIEDFDNYLKSLSVVVKAKTSQ